MKRGLCQGKANVDAMYSYDMLTKLKGQAVKDIWHAMLGKGAGIKNTTGLKYTEDIIQAILKAQEDPGFLQSFKASKTTDPKPQVVEKEEESMPRKKNPNPIIVPVPKKTVQAVESDALPQKNVEVRRVVVAKLIVGENEYFKDKETQQVYSMENGRPGQLLGVWDPQTRSILSQA